MVVPYMANSPPLFVRSSNPLFYLAPACAPRSVGLGTAGTAGSFIFAPVRAARSGGLGTAGTAVGTSC
jgi:hypothetical protein